jgi:hypothetical protein
LLWLALASLFLILSCWFNLMAFNLRRKSSFSSPSGIFANIALISSGRFVLVSWFASCHRRLSCSMA